MKRKSAKLRLATGLTSLLFCVLIVASTLGLIPDRDRAVLDGRAALSEAIAIHTSVLVSRGRASDMEDILASLIKRNPQLISAGLRQANGKLLVEAGGHSGQWRDVASEDSHVLVPVYSGDQPWGSVELRFTPVRRGGVLGLLLAPEALLMGFIVAVAFVLFVIYLRKMLEHLDPSKVVPQRVRTALDTLAEGLILLDLRERIVLANQAFGAQVGINPAELQGRRASTLPWSEAPDNQGHAWIRTLKDKVSVTGVMVTLRSIGNAPRKLLVNSAPVLSPNGQLSGALASFEDVTQLEQQKEELQASMAAAESANRAKSDFLARMSHDIRTPLNAVLGFTEALKRGFVEDANEREEYLNTIHSSGKHLLDLINDILDLSKVESGKLEVELTSCSPYEIISEVVAVLRVRAEQKGITLKFTSAGSVPERIRTDPARVRQVLMNLVGNAVKFTERGGVEIVARLSGSRQRPFLIDVIDTGIGISHENLDKVFDPFVQADSSITRRYGGTGLGLAISRQFAEAMNGTLSVASVEGKGSVFTLALDPGPLDGVALVDFARLGPRPLSRSVRALPRLPPGSVLLVDDGEENRKLVALILRRSGVDVELAVNGQEALEIASQRSFGVILMDMQMPIMDGFTATRLLRERGIKCAIIALTAHAMKEEELKCRAAGCSGFLAKPIDIDHLLKTVADELGDLGHEPAEGVTSAAAAPPDLTAIESTLPVDDPEIREIVVEFVERLGAKLSLMRDARSRMELPELAALAHWLKGSSGTVGFRCFHAPAEALERAAKERDLPAADLLLKELEGLAARIAVGVERAAAVVPAGSDSNVTMVS